MQKSSTRIGITIFLRRGFSWWLNGANQNVAFLWMCLRAAGFDVLLLSDGDGEPPPPEALPQDLRDGLEFVPISDETVDTLDVLIQAGAQVSAEHVARVRARGGKAIAFKFGSDFPIDAERTIHGKPSGGIFNGAQFDEIWTTAQHTAHNEAYWRITYRCPVRVLPHIWHPAFVNQIANDLSRAGHRVGYVPGRAKKQIVILEPNINLVKTCHIPILICEEAFRKAPEKIDRVFVLNSENIRTHQTFTSFVGNLDLCKAKADDGHPVISFEGRYTTPYFMSLHGDVVVSHQWIAHANYSHYDLLHLGYPLVHNAPDLIGIGYFYYDFDAFGGGRALLDCLENRYPPAPGAGRLFLESRIATARTNVDAHARAVIS